MLQPSLSLFGSVSAAFATLTAAVALAGPTRAQCNGFQSGTITADAGAVRYTQSSVPTGPGAGAGLADFSGDVGIQSDLLRELVFLYRILGDTRETAFNSGGGQCVRSTWPPTSSPDQGSIEWTDADGRGLIGALCAFQVAGNGADSGTLTARVTLTNLTGGAVTIDLFAYCDIDLCGANGNIGTTDNPTGTRHLIRSLTCPAETATFEGVGADRWEASGTGAVRAALFDTGLTDLGNTGLLLVGDYTAAMQWQARTIQAGATESFTVEIVHDSNRSGGCRNAASSVNYGTPQPGTNGIATITTTAPPQLGQVGRFAVSNGTPFTTGLLLTGFGRANIRIGNVTLWTQPILDTLLELDPNGAATMSFGIPNDGSLCQSQIHFQFLFVDPAVPRPFPIAYTDGLEWTLGV